MPFPLIAKKCAYSPSQCQPYKREAFLKIRALLRRAEARSHGAIVDALDRALSAVAARDARGFFEHCGYAVVGHP